MARRKTVRRTLLALPLLMMGCGGSAREAVVVYTSVDDVFARPVTEDFEQATGITVTIKTRLYEQIRELCATFHLILILVAHDPFEARALYHQAAVLENGTLREQGALDALLANPASMTLGDVRRATSRRKGGLRARTVPVPTSHELFGSAGGSVYTDRHHDRRREYPRTRRQRSG